MRAAAVKQKDYFILNGTKIWITNAEHAGVFLVMANANPTAVRHIFIKIKLIGFFWSTLLIPIFVTDIDSHILVFSLNKLLKGNYTYIFKIFTNFVQRTPQNVYTWNITDHHVVLPFYSCSLITPLAKNCVTCYMYFSRVTRGSPLL